MVKRGNAEGTIFHRKDGRWCAQVSLGRGRRKALYGTTRAQVARKLITVTKQLQDGLPVPTEQLTTGSFLAEWLDSVKSQVRPRTWRRYREYLLRHAIPVLGRIRLARLSAEDLEALYAAKIKEGLSPTTVRHLHTVLGQALRRAVRTGRLIRNVAELAKPPRVEHREMATLTVNQVASLLQAAAGDRLEALYVLACTTGARQGELLGLRWRHVDLDASTLEIAGTLQRLPKGEAGPGGASFVIAEPKTRPSRRTITLTASAVAVLRHHRIRQREEHLKLGPAWGELDLVFANEIGRPIEAGNLLRRSFWPLLERAGLATSTMKAEVRLRRGKRVKVQRKILHRLVRFHDLRHTAATLLLEGGAHPAIVAALLGHARTSTTLDVYSHVSPGLAATAATIMEDVLAGNASRVAVKTAVKRAPVRQVSARPRP
jgi:integrase